MQRWQTRAEQVSGIDELGSSKSGLPQTAKCSRLLPRGHVIHVAHLLFELLRQYYDTRYDHQGRQSPANIKRTCVHRNKDDADSILCLET